MAAVAASASQQSHDLAESMKRPAGTTIRPHRPHDAHMVPLGPDTPGPQYDPDVSPTRSRSPTTKFGSSTRHGSDAKSTRRMTPGPVYDTQNRMQPHKTSSPSFGFGRSTRFSDGQHRSISPGPKYAIDRVPTDPSPQAKSFGKATRSPSPTETNVYTPGPGAYTDEDKYTTISRVRKSPTWKFGTGGRSRLSAGGESPGPAYDTSAAEHLKYKTAPATAFPKSKSAAEVDMGKGENVPGPKYQPTYDLTLPKSPGVKIGTAPQKSDPPRNGTADHPGFVYDVDKPLEVVKKQQPAYSFGKSAHSKAKTTTVSTPGPKYAPEADNVVKPSAPRFSFGRESQRKAEVTPDSPGPVYSPDTSPTKSRLPAYRFGTAERQPDPRVRRAAEVPGPKYDVTDEVVKKSAPRPVFGHSDRGKLVNSIAPGPIYDPDVSAVRPKAPTPAVFGREKRSPDLNKDKVAFPAPGAYSPNSNLTMPRSPAAVLSTTG